jgi:hypothetical protein
MQLPSGQRAARGCWPPVPKIYNIRAPISAITTTASGAAGVSFVSVSRARRGTGAPLRAPVPFPVIPVYVCALDISPLHFLWLYCRSSTAVCPVATACCLYPARLAETALPARTAAIYACGVSLSAAAAAAPEPPCSYLESPLPGSPVGCRCTSFALLPDCNWWPRPSHLLPQPPCW